MNPYKRAIQEHTVKAYLFAFLSAVHTPFFLVGEVTWRTFVNGIFAYIWIEVAMWESRKVELLRHGKDST